MQKKIYGYFTKGETEETCDVTIMLPPAEAAFFRVESQWDMELDCGQNLMEAAIEMIEEQAVGEMEDELYENLCSYLEDEENWEGDVEEGEVFEGLEAVERFLNARGANVWTH